MHSLFPKQPESDLPQVIERMQKLQAEQKALMQKGGDSQAVQLKKHRDVACSKQKVFLKPKLGAFCSFLLFSVSLSEVRAVLAPSKDLVR